LDTNIFVSQNFLEGKYIKNILGFGSTNDISIVLPQVTVNEIKAQFRLKVSEAMVAYKEYMKSSNARYLKNVEFGQKVNDYEYSKIKIDDLCAEFNAKLDEEFSLANVVVIPYGKLDSKNILEPYFKNEPPFSVKKDKKHGFPDAFIIESLKKWVKENDKSLTVVSNDADFSFLNSEFDALTVIPEIQTIYNKVVNQIKVRQEKLTQERLEVLDAIFSAESPKIIEQIKEYFKTGVLDDLSYYYEYTTENIYDISNLQFKDFDNHGYSIKEIHNEEEIEIEVLIDFTFMIDVLTDDLDSWVYDSEDKEVHYRHTTTVTFEGKVELAFNAMLYIIDKKEFDNTIEFDTDFEIMKIEIHDPYSPDYY
jgi:hypothetical protein